MKFYRMIFHHSTLTPTWLWHYASVSFWEKKFENKGKGKEREKEKIFGGKGNENLKKIPVAFYTQLVTNHLENIINDGTR